MANMCDETYSSGSEGEWDILNESENSSMSFGSHPPLSEENDVPVEQSPEPVEPTETVIHVPDMEEYNPGFVTSEDESAKENKSDDDKEEDSSDCESEYEDSVELQEAREENIHLSEKLMELQLGSAELKKQLNTEKSNKDELSQKLAETMTERDHFMDELKKAQFETEYMKAMENLLNDTEEKLSLEKTSNQELSQQLTEIHSEMESLKFSHDQIEKGAMQDASELSKANRQLTLFEQQLTANATMISELNQKLRMVDEQNYQMIDQLHVSTQQLKALGKLPMTVAELEKSLESQRHETAEARRLLDSTCYELNVTKTTNIGLHAELDRLRVVEVQLEKTSTDNCEAFRAEHGRSAYLQDEIDQLTIRLNKAELERDMANSALAELEKDTRGEYVNELHQLQNEITNLQEERIATINSINSDNAAEIAALKAAHDVHISNLTTMAQAMRADSDSTLSKLQSMQNENKSLVSHCQDMHKKWNQDQAVKDKQMDILEKENEQLKEQVQQSKKSEVVGMPWMSAKTKSLKQVLAHFSDNVDKLCKDAHTVKHSTMTAESRERMVQLEKESELLIDQWEKAVNNVIANVEKIDINVQEYLK